MTTVAEAMEKAGLVADTTVPGQVELFDFAAEATIDTEIPKTVLEALNAAHGFELQAGATYSDAFTEGVKTVISRRNDVFRSRDKRRK